MPFSLPDRPVRIEAPGIVLRGFLSIDGPDLVLAFADEEIARWNPGPIGPDAAAEFMKSRNDWSGSDHASWAVADSSDRLVGSVSLHRIDTDQADAEIGYWVAPWARRKGYATRAVQAASRFAFTQLGLHRVYLYHAVENPGSCAVAVAAGYLHEGTLRESFRHPGGAYHDEHLHGILATDIPDVASAMSPTPRNGPRTRLSDLDVARVRRWCREKVPERVRHQVRYECDVAPGHLTVVDCRPPVGQDDDPEWTRFPVARLRFTKGTGLWTIYWRDRNEKFHLYDRTPPTQDIEVLLAELDADPTCIFWG
ncbi:MAG TPA: GNAT family N-acetyltransferase [Propionibacteriaceae bacterium]|nr:GNAT family N-acetyltransferase [Propionibacteriaceae bacterium]